MLLNVILDSTVRCAVFPLVVQGSWEVHKSLAGKLFSCFYRFHTICFRTCSFVRTRQRGCPR